MTRLWAVICMCCGSMAQGQQDRCAALQGFAKDQEVVPLGLGPADCATSLVLGAGASYDCHWTYDFRSDAARAAFAELSAMLAACAIPTAEAEGDGALVNHPDSFDQITALMGAHALSLSIKDKGRLGQTLVFLRAAQADP